MNKIYHVIYAPAHHLESSELSAIEEKLDEYFKRQYTPIEGGGVSIADDMVETSNGAKSVLEDLKSISEDLKILILPRDDEEDYLIYPEHLVELLEPAIHREDPRFTRVEVLKIFDRT